MQVKTVMSSKSIKFPNPFKILVCKEAKPDA